MLREASGNGQMQEGRVEEGPGLTVVPQATVGADLLEALEVIAQLHVEGVGDNLAELAILGVLLAVEHPVGHLELPRVLHDRHQTLDLFRRELTSPVTKSRNSTAVRLP